MHAVSALAPSHGAIAACDGLPSNTISMRERERDVRQQIAIERMEHHRRVDSRNTLGLEHARSCRRLLLRRGRREFDRAGDSLAHRREGEERSEGAARDEVVPASVADVGQRVVLGQDGDPGPLAPPIRALKAVSSPPSFCSIDTSGRRPLRGAKLPRPFGKAELGMVVDSARQIAQPIGLSIHRQIKLLQVEAHAPDYSAPRNDTGLSSAGKARRRRRRYR